MHPHIYARVRYYALAAILALAPGAAYAQTDGDPGTIAQNILTTLGGKTGGLLAAAAFVVCCILGGTGMVPPRHAAVVFFLFGLAWSGSWAITKAMGWT